VKLDKSYGVELPDESSESESEEAPEVDAAQDVLDAISAKDAKALSLALERHYAYCQGEADETEDDTDSED
jgi:DNA-binding GntR family transcriptional regulator